MEIEYDVFISFKNSDESGKFIKISNFLKLYTLSFFNIINNF